MDRYENLLPIGIYGELYLGGDGVARGYLNQPELIKEKFIQSPFFGGNYIKAETSPDGAETVTLNLPAERIIKSRFEASE